jgi:hypothetical protein
VGAESRIESEKLGLELNLPRETPQTVPPE